jgi:hypothetical protein
VGVVQAVTHIEDEATIQATVSVNRHQTPAPTSIEYPSAISNDISVDVKSVGDACPPYIHLVTVLQSEGGNVWMEVLLIIIRFVPFLSIA